ncbi:MAG: SBBP repeat-containing protein [Anaerolineae bacterium]|nr:SBBP repeat-containing protein [Phycisphaerae bacterium]
MNQKSTHVETLEPRQLLAAYPISVGSTTYDSAFEITKLANDGVLVAGLLKGTIDLDPSANRSLLTARGDTDIYVARYSEAGGLVWARRFGGVEGDFQDGRDVDTPTDPSRAGPFDLGVGLQTNDLGEYVTAVATDANENFYIAGSFRGSVDFDPSSRDAILNSYGGKEFIDIFLLKLDIDGNFVFVKQIGGDFTDVAQGMVVTGNQIHLTGYYTRLADFDPGAAKVTLSTNDRSRENAFVAKYNTNGVLAWTKDIANNDINRARRNTGNSIAVDSQGNSYIAGSFSGQTDFDPSSAQVLVKAVKETDAFVLKLNSAGGFAFVKTFGGEGYDGAQEIALSPQGGLYVASYFEEIVDSDPNPNVVRNIYATPEEIGETADRSDIVISKFNSIDGSVSWAKSVGSEGWETIGGLAVNPSNGAVFLSGGFYGSADFNPGRGRAVLTSTLGAEDFEDPNDGDRDNSYDAFLWKLDSNGNYVFAVRFGAQSDDYGTALSVDPANGNLALAGQFRGSIRLPPSSAKLRPIGIQDSFISLYNSLGDLLT